MKKINIAIQVGSSEDIEGVLAYCSEHGIRACSLRAMLAALGRFLGRVALRLTDIVVSLSLLLTLFPLLYIITAIVIKRRSPGPAIVVEPAMLADGRQCGLFNFRLGTASQRPLIALAPRLINILLGQLSLFGQTPTPIVAPEPESEPANATPKANPEATAESPAEDPDSVLPSMELQPNVDGAQSTRRWSSIDVLSEPGPIEPPSEAPAEDVEDESLNTIYNTEKENNVISE